VARAAGLIAVAVLPAAAGLTGSAYLPADAFSSGFKTASFISAGLCVLGGALAAFTIRNPGRAAREPAATEAVAAAAPGSRPLLHCGLDSPPPRSAQATPHDLTKVPHMTKTLRR
jgi:hypothetical protein